MKRTRFISGLLILFAGFLGADSARGQGRAARPAEDQLVSSVDSMISILPEMEVRHRNVVAAADSIGALFGALSERVTEVAHLTRNQEAGALARAIHTLQESNVSFNLQYLQLQQRMQNESRRFTLLSNIMKTKHDTAKNVVQNIR